MLKRHGRHVPEQRLLLSPCCIAGACIMPVHLPIKYRVQGQNHIWLPVDCADSDSRLATVFHDRQQTEGNASGLAWTQTPAVPMPHRNRQPVRAIMRHLFGRSKPRQAPADGSFTQQQVEVFAVLQAATLVAPCACHRLMGPTACATFTSLQHIAVAVRACVSLHRHAWPTSWYGLFA